MSRLSIAILCGRPSSIPKSIRRARIACIAYRSTYTVHGSLAIALARKLMGIA